MADYTNEQLVAMAKDLLKKKAEKAQKNKAKRAAMAQLTKMYQKEFNALVADNEKA